MTLIDFIDRHADGLGFLFVLTLMSIGGFKILKFIGYEE